MAFMADVREGAHLTVPTEEQRMSHGASRAERRTAAVALLTVVTMTIELGAGQLFGSMALVADGLHMASHALAMGVAVFTYSYARRHAASPRFAFGTGKVNALGGYTGAALLGLTAVWMVWESLERLGSPGPIQYREAIGVASLGLAVNLASAWLLRDDHGHHHAGDHAACTHDHDHNLRAAYLHVVADAVTSVLAIAALLAARRYGAPWLDPVVGLLGAGLVAWWAVGLLRVSSAVLLDHQAPDHLTARIRSSIEADGSRVRDLRCWALAPGRYAVAAAVSTDTVQPAAYYRELVGRARHVAWVSIDLVR